MDRQYGGLHSHVLYTFSLSIGRICHNFSLLEDGKCSGCYSHDSIRYMHPNVHCNSVYSSQDMETMNMSFNRGMDKDVLCIHIEKEMTTHCSTLVWDIQWTEEPGRLWSMGSQRIRRDWDWTHIFICVYTHTHTCVWAHTHTVECCSAIKRTKLCHFQRHGWV